MSSSKRIRLTEQIDFKSLPKDLIKKVIDKITSIKTDSEIFYIFKLVNGRYKFSCPEKKISQIIEKKDIVVADLNDDRITRIYNKLYFYDCKNLIKVNLPKNLKIIPDRFFYNCTALASIIFPENLESIGKEAFFLCTKIKEIYLPKSLKVLGKACFADCCFEIVKISENIVSIEEKCFYNCQYLRTVNFQNCIHLNRLGKYCFYNCYSLISLTIPDNCFEIEELCFSNCYSLEKIILSNNLFKLGKFAFKECSSLKKISSSQFKENKLNLLPKGITYISEGTFCGCSSLTNFIIFQYLKDRAFICCSNLTKIYYFDKKHFQRSKEIFFNCNEKIKFYMYQRDIKN